MQDREISEAIAREQERLRNFIRRRLADEADVEDVLQDVFYELVELYRLAKPVEQLSAWLFRVARNRIVDLFRRRRPVLSLEEPVGGGAEGEPLLLKELLPAAGLGPEANLVRSLLVEELEAALAELPEEQREVFLAHEIEGQSFQQIAAASGVNINTLLSRKRSAVLRLRKRLRALHDELSDER